jgi:hypothetical protein
MSVIWLCVYVMSFSRRSTGRKTDGEVDYTGIMAYHVL